MIGIQIKNGFIDFSNTNFLCPYCDKKYNDLDDKYLNRCNKNKFGYTRIYCECKNIFYFTYDYKGDSVSFKPVKKFKNEQI